MLKHGAYALYNGNDGGEDLASEDIDSILRRATQLTYDSQQNGGGGLSGFAKAVFQTDDASAAVSVDDEQFWDKILPEQVWPGRFLVDK